MAYLLVGDGKAFFAAREMIGLAESSRRLGVQKDGCTPEDYEAVGRALTPTSEGGEALELSDGDYERNERQGTFITLRAVREEVRKLRVENERLREQLRKATTIAANRGKRKLDLERENEELRIALEECRESGCDW